MLNRIKELEKKISNITSLCLLTLLLTACSDLVGTSPSTGGAKIENPLSKTQALKTQNKEELALLKEAEDDYASELFTSARKNFEKFKESFPASNSVNLAILKIADCRFYASEYPEAVTAYEDYLNTFPSSEASPYAFFQVGESWRLQSKGIDRDQTPLKKALTTFEEVLKRYPGTPSAKKATFAINAINEQFSEYNKIVADFYLKIGKDKAAKARALESNSFSSKSPNNDLTVKDTQQVEQSKSIHQEEKAVEQEDLLATKEQDAEEKSETEILRNDKRSSLNTEKQNTPTEETGIFAGIFSLFSSAEPVNSAPSSEDRGDELQVVCKNLGKNKFFTIATMGEKLNFKVEQKKLKFMGVGKLTQSTCKGTLQINSINDDAILALPMGETTIFQPDRTRLVAIVKSKL